ncbi:SDR family NAD(P)-dependent oxidoreductase [Algoriphagus namhaensis]|uniref:SDR family NAD(P)-dependent oxidoreductase n=1 Tax=Algoriphagus namhaensis TaxID=915353 RepID=A0ABV8ARV5_9BACT
MSLSLIIITGAGSGIGLHLAQTLKGLKYSLLLIDLNSNSLENHFEEDDTLQFLSGDISQPAIWDQILHVVRAQKATVSHLFNCAGVIRPGFVRDFDINDIDYHLNVNTKGSILGIKYVADQMKNQGFGHVITISSLAGLAPVSGLSLYSASKFAIRGFAMAAAAEYRPYGVNISVVCPDLVKTPMLDLQLDYPEEAKLTFSGPEKVLTPADVTRVLLQLMEKPKDLVCIPESRGLLAKVAGIWPGLGEIFRKSLEAKGEKVIKKLR